MDNEKEIQLSFLTEPDGKIVYQEQEDSKRNQELYGFSRISLYIRNTEGIAPIIDTKYQSIRFWHMVFYIRLDSFSIL